jgi:vacuolar protein sorting-associated protein 52
MESVVLYVENSDQVSGLHRKMQECDGVLARMEEMLHGFQADLGEISAQIKHLQSDSLSMSIRLKNRREAESMLHKFIDNGGIMPWVASTIVSDYINDEFLSAINVLSERLKYLEQTEPATDGSSLDVAPSETFCGRQLLPEFEKLKIKAISKIRDYLSSQFMAIRKPKTNISMVQQNSLVKYAPLFQFIQREAPIVADDLRYVRTLLLSVLHRIIDLL